MEHKERSVTFNYNTHCNLGRGVGWWKGLVGVGVGGVGGHCGQGKSSRVERGRCSTEREREREGGGGAGRKRGVVYRGQ